MGYVGLLGIELPLTRSASRSWATPWRATAGAYGRCAARCSSASCAWPCSPFLASVCSPFLIARRQLVAAGKDWIGVRALGGWRSLDVADIREIVTKDTTVLLGLRCRPAVNRKFLLTVADGRTLALEREPAELGVGALLAAGLHPATSLTPEAAELLRTVVGGGEAACEAFSN